MICGKWLCDDHGGPVSKYLVDDPSPRKGLFCVECWQGFKSRLACPLVSMRQLDEGIRSLGIAGGDVLEVHSSLRAFGRVDAAAAQIVELLKSIVTEAGTIIMHTPMESDTCDPASALSGTGLLTNVFWQSEGAVRSGGKHSWTSWGRAGDVVRGPCDMVARHGKCLGLGVGIWNCTMIHVPEWELGIEYPCVCPEAFYRHQLELRESSASYREARVGNAVCWSCDAADIADFFSARLRGDRLSLLCPAGNGCLLCNSARADPEKTWGT